MEEVKNNCAIEANKTDMENTVKSIIEKMEEFKKDSEKSVKGNKAAGVRARKLSLEIEKDMKAYRKLSILCK